jgi:hypothetical protein
MNMGRQMMQAHVMRVQTEIEAIESSRVYGNYGPSWVAGAGRRAAYGVAADVRGHNLRGGLGELTMDQMHVVLATTSFAAGALVMHLLHRYKVMR